MNEKRISVVWDPCYFTYYDNEGEPHIGKADKPVPPITNCPKCQSIYFMHKSSTNPLSLGSSYDQCLKCGVYWYS